jgi:hypothetical protein
MSNPKTLLVSEFVEKFKARYLTVSGYKKLTPKQRNFHLLGHWNLLHDDGEFLYHSYLNGATGETEKVISKIRLDELDKFLFIPYNETFILFITGSRYGLTPKLVSNRLSRHCAIRAEHIWLHEKGIQLQRKVMSFAPNMLIDFIYIDAITGEPILNQSKTAAQ